MIVWKQSDKFITASGVSMSSSILTFLGLIFFIYMNIRVNRKSYTTLSNYPISDGNLSAISLGIFCYIMSKPNGWKAHKNEIYKRFQGASISTSKNAIDQAFKELVSCGYVQIKAVTTTNEKGQKIFNGKEYVFNEEPNIKDLPKSEDFGSSEISDIGNLGCSEIIPHIIKTDLIVNTNNIINNENDKFISFPLNFSHEMINISTEFFIYRKEIGKPFKSKKSKELRLSQWSQQIDSYGEQPVIESIKTAIANQYQGTFIDKQYLNTQKPIKDEKGNYSDTTEGRELFISNIRERAIEELRKFRNT
jgi:hypothetical protein